MNSLAVRSTAGRGGLIAGDDDLVLKNGGFRGEPAISDLDLFDYLKSRSIAAQ